MTDDCIVAYSFDKTKTAKRDYVEVQEIQRGYTKTTEDNDPVYNTDSFDSFDDFSFGFDEGMF